MMFLLSACRAAIALGDLDAQLADKQVAVAAAKAQLSAHDKHLTQQDVTIKGLLRKQVTALIISLWFLETCHGPVTYLVLIKDTLCTGSAGRTWSFNFEKFAHTFQVCRQAPAW